MQHQEAIIQTILKGKLEDVQSAILKALGDGYSPEELDQVLLPVMKTVSQNSPVIHFGDVLISARAIGGD